MFAVHQPIVADYASKSPENLYKVLQFVQVTINQHFYLIPRILTDLANTGDSTLLTMRQKTALRYYWDNQEEIYNTFFYEPKIAAQQLFAFVGLPGLGIPKAGFVLQLLTGKGGCMDTHNLRLYGLNPKAFRADCSHALLKKRCDLYLTLCHQIGTEALWNTWCSFMAHRYPKHFFSSFAVSALHVDCILGDSYAQ